VVDRRARGLAGGHPGRLATVGVLAFVAGSALEMVVLRPWAGVVALTLKAVAFGLLGLAALVLSRRAAGRR
jgi:hypothetical protein